MKHFLQALKSAFRAAFGVQSGKELEADFSGKRAGPASFIIAGILLTLLFIGALLWIVQLIIPES